MHYITITGILLAIWGLIKLDWFKVGIGVIMFLIAFLFDIIKNKNDYKVPQNALEEMNFKTNGTTTFMFIVGALFIISGLIQFIDWVDVGIGTAILLVAFAIDMKKNRIN